MRGEDKVIDVSQGACLLLFGIAQQPVMVEIAEAGGRVGGVIDDIGDEEDGAEDDGGPVCATMSRDRL